MNILVTGGAGFIGANLIKRLVKDGHNVVSIDNYSTGKEENHQEGCQYVKADIRDIVNYDTFMENPDIVYHLAALPRIQPSFEYPALTLEVGIMATMSILEWAREKKCKVIYAGSSSVHSGKYKNPYTFSKVMGDELCMMYKNIYDVDVSVCRFYNVYGDFMPMEGGYRTVLPIFLEQYRKGETITVTGDGEQRRDFTQVDDIVDGLIRCGKGLSGSDDRAVITGKIFELGRGKNYSINEIAGAFGDYPTEYIDKRPGEMRNTLNTDTKAKDLLGWEPTVDILDYIKKYILKK